jgi:glycosyltransferase involved in cell wall biosynthesis
VSRLAVDCHMVGQPEAGDAGNARYAVGLVAALAATAALGDAVAALSAWPVAAAALDPGAERLEVGAGNARRLTRDAPRALERWGADAAVFTYVAPPRARCPVLLAVHDATFRLFPGWLDRRARMVLSAFVPASAGRARLVLALSETAKADLVAALDLDPERVRVVSPAPAPVFTPAPGAPERVRDRWGLDRYCLAVGDVGPRKNLGALAEALARLAEPGLELALVGRTGAGGKAILGGLPARRLGAVSDDDLADLYRAAAVTAQPSLYEGFGLPVLEAMACGSPVVTSDRGALPEVAGDAAVVVPPDAAALAEGIRAALEPATAARLRAAGPAQAAAYTVEGMGRAAWTAARAAGA